MSDIDETVPTNPSISPKIPPPPSEHPPPYTPFCTPPTSAPLLEPSTSRSANQNNRNPTNRVIIQPQGINKYLQYVTKKNLIIAGLLFLIVIVFFILATSSSNEESDAEKTTKLEVRQLKFDKKSLGASKLSGQRISFDEHENAIILSKYIPDEQKIQSEKVILNDENTDENTPFLSKFQNVDSKNGDFKDCMKFTSEVICCSTSSHSKHHKTECFLKHRGIFKRSIFYVKNSIYKIDENRMLDGYISEGFFFPMDTRQELDELVRFSGEFRICEYLNTKNNSGYILQDGKCKKTPFEVEYELPKVKFCSNPVYTAVLQYGHHFEQDTLSWHLKIKYDSEEAIYRAKDSVRTKNDELALDCNEETLEIFVVGEMEVIQYSVPLPNPSSKHFLERTLR
uniref:Uncharacterized protein n=1 Tax=Acrobeloides nanus TaxID=290746 RepID=A0A914DP43_9BILA